MMKYSFRPSDVEMVDYLRAHTHCAIWADMGSGKTACTAHVVNETLDSLEITRWLIVGTPRIASVVWKSDFEKWDVFQYLTRRYYQLTAEDLPVEKVKKLVKGKEQTVLRLVHSRRSRAEILGRQAEVFTIHYDLLPRLVKLFGDDWPFDGVVLDESSMVSNQDTDRFRALRRVRLMVKRLYELTGTPSANGLEKLYSQMYLLDGGKRLGSTLTAFRETFMMPDDVRGRNGEIYRYKPQPGARERIYDLLSDIVYAPEPVDFGVEVVPNYIEVELPPEARKVYDDMEREMLVAFEDETGGDETVVEAPTAAALGTKLLQMCNGAVFDADRKVIEIHSAKLEALKELYEVTDGQLLLAYWFNHDRTRIKKAMRFAVDLAEDAKFEEHWNAGKIGLGMMQARQGSHGLNLQDGGYVACWFGAIHDLEVYLQYNKRLARPGQKSAKVYIHHIVAKNTLEEDILYVSNRAKDDEQNSLIEAIRRRAKRANHGR